jgi:general secretion pathway protein A
MLFQSAVGLQLNPDPTTSTAELWRTLTDRLTEFHYQQLETVFLFDDADRAEKTALAQISRLARYDASPSARLTLVLAGQRETLGRIGASLLDLVELRTDLEPWDASDTINYLQNLLVQAGCPTPVFTEPAVARLHELTQGIPRRVSQLADLSLLAGAGQNSPQIDADVVESAYYELGARD